MEMNERNYYLKTDGTRCDIPKKELQQKCLYSNNTFNREGYLKVLKVLGYEHDEVLLDKSFNGSCFELGRYLQLINIVKGNKEDEKISLTEKAIQTLKVDIDLLLDKSKASLDNNNFSNYKMLINNLKDTIELLNTLEHPKTENVQNYTVNIPDLEEIAKYTSKKIVDNLRTSGMGRY